MGPEEGLPVVDPPLMLPLPLLAPGRGEGRLDWGERDA